MRSTWHRFVLAGAPLLVGGFLAGRLTAGDGRRLFESVFEIVSHEAVDSVDTNRLYQLAATGLVDQLHDPYAALQNRDDYSRFARNSLGNRYGGLGLRIIQWRGGLAVARVLPGGPAERGGVHQGDRIVAVEDSTTDGWTVDRASATLTGVPGTKVRVTFARSPDGTRYQRSFERAVISPASVPFVSLLPGGVGYLPLTTFSDHAASDVRSALRQLQAAGAERLVLDLRGNLGGNLDQAVAMAGLFLEPRSSVVRVQYRDHADTLRALGGLALPRNLPTAVLLDSNSASASEIVAGALQDHDRALLIGTTTFGKGLVQSVYTLDDGWVLRLTSGHWYTPSGRLIQRLNRDSAEPLATRPVYHSSLGRVVLGGGGIPPDVEVGSTPLPDGERRVADRLNGSASTVNQVLDDYAAQLERELHPGFAIQPAWRAELVRRLKKAGVALPDSLVSQGGELLDRLLANRAGLFVDSDSTAFIRAVPRDHQLDRAVELLRGAMDQGGLFALASAQTSPG